MKPFSKRYNRQIALPELGIEGQHKLANAKVLVVGAGGLGCPVLQSLAASGVGQIGIVDGDIVEETNLHRQYLYAPPDCGKNKATVAAAMLSKQNPEIIIVSHACFFEGSNAFELVADYQIIVDCTDTLPARYLINDVALTKGIPMVYASIHHFEGQLSVFNYRNGPSFRCLFPSQVPKIAIPNCDDAGVLGVIPNMLGTLQATEVLKIILGIGQVLSGKLLVYEGLNGNMQKIQFQKNEAEIENGLANGSAILNQRSIVAFGIVNANAFLNEVATNTNLILDIREAFEEPKLAIARIQLIPLGELEDYLKSVSKSQKIILLCQNGNRSAMTAHYLIKNGFESVFHLENGIAALTKLNLQIE